MNELKPLDLSPETNSKQQLPIKTVGKKSKKKLAIWFLSLIILGFASGFGLTLTKKPTTVKEYSRTTQGEIKKGDTYGIADEKSFRDSAEGQVAKGGVDGEGSHHLIREGGESQYVYLTSSIIDLDQFIDRRVKVWGETFQAQKAGWLMDVGKLEVLE